MPHRSAVAVFALGALILAVGVFVSPLIGSAESDAQTAVELSDNQSETVHQNLDVVAAINTTSGNATFTFTNSRTLDRNSTSVLQTGQSETLRLSGESITVNNSQFRDPTVVADVTFPPTFGYDDSVKTFYDNLGLLLAFVGFFFVIGGLMMGVKTT